MIHVACISCGGTIRAADAASGTKARCPFCNAMVDIPGRSRPGGSQEAIAALTAALDSHAGAAGSPRPAVPPPPPSPEPPSVDLDVEISRTGSMDETDVLPAIPEPEIPAGGWSRRRRKKRRTAEPARHEEKPRAIRLLVLVSAVAIGLAAVGMVAWLVLQAATDA